jgi:hypothetical protein
MKTSFSLIAGIVALLLMMLIPSQASAGAGGVIGPGHRYYPRYYNYEAYPPYSYNCPTYRYGYSGYRYGYPTYRHGYSYAYPHTRRYVRRYWRRW